MLDSANERIGAADVLEKSMSLCDSSYLLKLLALEILLKACHLAYHGEPPRSHAYARIYEPLPNEVKARIVEDASARFPTYTDFSDMPALLKKFGTYFVELRYYYDHHGKEYSYSPFELTALLEALQGEVTAYLQPHKR